MNRKFVQILTAVLVAGYMFSCGEKTTTATSEISDAAANSEDWTMMDEFHIVMAEAFHPYKDSANLQPAKELAADMVAAAEKWAKSPLPAQVDNDVVKGKIDELTKETKQFQETVQSGNDAEISSQLNALHDLFHELQDAWYHAEHE